MRFQNNLIHGRLLKRYKRFLADIILDNNTVITAHCTNSGSMKSCLEENAEVYLSPGNNPNRKTKYTWEMIKINGSWVGINTNNPNLIAYEAVVNKEIKQLQGYTEVKREVKWNDSRFDIFAKNNNEACFIEVKNVTYKEGVYALFPDAKTERGLKHLKTLVEAKKKGFRTVMLYIIQRTDIEFFAPAKAIDPKYAEMLKVAFKKGIEIIPVMVKVSPTEISILKEIPFEL